MLQHDLQYCFVCQSIHFLPYYLSGTHIHTSNALKLPVIHLGSKEHVQDKYMDSIHFATQDVQYNINIVTVIFVTNLGHLYTG